MMLQCDVHLASVTPWLPQASAEVTFTLQCGTLLDPRAPMQTYYDAHKGSDEVSDTCLFKTKQACQAGGREQMGRQDTGHGNDEYKSVHRVQ